MIITLCTEVSPFRKTSRVGNYKILRAVFVAVTMLKSSAYSIKSTCFNGEIKLHSFVRCNIIFQYMIQILYDYSYEERSSLGGTG